MLRDKAIHELLTYEELVQLYEQPVPAEPLQRKLTALLNTPFVSNAAEPARSEATKASESSAWPFSASRLLEHRTWTCSTKRLKRALGGTRTYAALLHNTTLAHSSSTRAAALKEAALLNQADVIVLNEVDWGMKRTDYRNVIADLASALRMNYAYGVEFVEVDPIALGLEKFEGVKNGDEELIRDTKVDPAKYKGLHGTAILSRYRLENVQLIPLQFQGHDWYAGRKEKRRPG